MTQDSHQTTDTSADATSPDLAADATDATAVPENADEARTGRSTDSSTDTSTRTSTDTRADTRATTDDTSRAAGGEQLVPQEAVMDFRARWEAIQQGFVDDPRSAVTDADALVSDVLKKLSTTFEEQHGQLESQWSDGEPDTEDLRSALRRYRDFFDRLLAI